jgi:hypothetical protein
MFFLRATKYSMQILGERVEICRKSYLKSFEALHTISSKKYSVARKKAHSNEVFCSMLSNYSMICFGTKSRFTRYSKCLCLFSAAALKILGLARTRVLE